MQNGWKVITQKKERFLSCMGWEKNRFSGNRLGVYNRYILGPQSCEVFRLVGLNRTQSKSENQTVLRSPYNFPKILSFIWGEKWWS